MNLLMKGIIMMVRLIEYTSNPELVVTRAARTCYMGPTTDIIKSINTPDEKLIRHLIKRGHHSVLEHASFTFLIDGISRAMTHQLVRHRIASYSQQSQRYVSLQASKTGQFPYVIPPSIIEAGMEDWFKEKMQLIQKWYDDLCKKLKSRGLKGEDIYQDARYILPNATQTRIVVTMNARELRHFFSLRCCARAQWEIRSVAIEMLKQVKKIAPILFEDAGPPCIRGSCPEDYCSKYHEVVEFFSKL